VLLRAAQLGPDVAPVLDAAAVAGNEFDVELVLAVAGAPEWPEQLASCGLVSAVSDGRAAFRHALTRDAAYAAVPGRGGARCTRRWPAGWRPGTRRRR
jgi:predicted ATPase